MSFACLPVSESTRFAPPLYLSIVQPPLLYMEDYTYATSIVKAFGESQLESQNEGCRMTESNIEDANGNRLFMQLCAIISTHEKRQLRQENLFHLLDVFSGNNWRQCVNGVDCQDAAASAFSR